MEILFTILKLYSILILFGLTLSMLFFEVKESGKKYRFYSISIFLPILIYVSLGGYFNG